MTSMARTYEQAGREESVARLRRGLALRAMVLSGQSQRAIAERLGVSQPAVSQRLKAMPRGSDIEPALLLEAAAPVLKQLAQEHGFTRLAVFGSLARDEGRLESDIDLLVEAPANMSSFGFVKFKGLVEGVLDREIDLVEYGGLTPGLDDDISREAVLL